MSKSNGAASTAQDITDQQINLVNLDLNSSGFPELKQLEHTRLNYSKALPILIKWLWATESSTVRSLLVGIMTAKWAKPAGHDLIKAFSDQSASGKFAHVRWDIGSALEKMANDDIAEDLIRLAGDRGYGRDRQMIVMSLSKLSSPRTTEVLLAQLDDDDVVRHALEALRRIAPIKARPAVQLFLNHKDAYVRSLAKKVLAAIDKKYSAESVRQTENAISHAVTPGGPLPFGYEETSTSTDNDEDHIGDLFDILSKILKPSFKREYRDEALATVSAIVGKQEIVFELPVVFDNAATTIRIDLKLEDCEVDFHLFGKSELITAFNLELEKLFQKWESE